MEVVDLHLHSTASDGDATAEHVVKRAADAGVAVIALTDHDTVAGVAEATTAGAALGVRVVAGCEFSVKAWWGELHLLGFFLPAEDAELNGFLTTQLEGRLTRAQEIVQRLMGLGVPVSMESVQRHAKGTSIGRPHVARALVEEGFVGSMNEAFDRYLADDGPACVPKTLPSLETVTDLVRRLGGVTSAAHLKERSTKATLARLLEAGVDAVEVLHPSHDDATVFQLDEGSTALGLLKSGGSDWHGDGNSNDTRRRIGGLRVPDVWLDALDRLHRERIATGG
jgi:predicted metal-dependent phosphoesterase TrpH